MEGRRRKEKKWMVEIQLKVEKQLGKYYYTMVRWKLKGKFSENTTESFCGMR
jgi:ferritin-like protein